MSYLTLLTQNKFQIHLYKCRQSPVHGPEDDWCQWCWWLHEDKQWLRLDWPFSRIPEWWRMQVEAGRFLHWSRSVSNGFSTTSEQSWTTQAVSRQLTAHPAQGIAGAKHCEQACITLLYVCCKKSLWAWRTVQGFQVFEKEIALEGVTWIEGATTTKYLPQTLAHLTFGRDSNQSLKGVTLPSRLQCFACRSVRVKIVWSKFGTGWNKWTANIVSRSSFRSTKHGINIKVNWAVFLCATDIHMLAIAIDPCVTSFGAHHGKLVNPKS